MLEAVIFLIAVPLKLTEKSTRFMYYHTRRMDNGSGSRRRLLLVRSQPRKSIPQMLPCCDHTARSSLKCSLSEYSSFSSVSLCFLYCTLIKQKSQSLFCKIFLSPCRVGNRVCSILSGIGCAVGQILCRVRSPIHCVLNDISRGVHHIVRHAVRPIGIHSVWICCV